MPASLAKAEPAREAAIADDLLVRIYTLANRMERLLDKAEAANQYRDAAALAREVRSNLELVAKLRGDATPLRDLPPCIRHLPLNIAQFVHAWPSRLVAPHRFRCSCMGYP